MNKCVGCGAILQSADETKPGYVVESKINEEGILCKRCFKIKNYNEVTSVGLSENDYLEVIHNIESNSLIVYLIDLFDFEGSFINGINRILFNQDIILLGNKIDLFPKSVNKNKLRNFMQHKAKDMGLRVVDSEVISAHKGLRIDEAVELINKHQKKRNVYIVGCTNVGKSSFINTLLKKYANVEDALTTSIYPGTTISTIEIDFNGKLLIDTPGIINNHQAVHYLNESLKQIMPYKGIKPIIYQISEGKTLFIEGLVRLDLMQGEDVSLIIYKANALEVYKTNTIKADEYYSKHITEMLNPPTTNELSKLGKMIKTVYTLKEKEEIVISGLGFITVNKPCKIVVHLYENIKSFKRSAII